LSDFYFTGEPVNYLFYLFAVVLTLGLGACSSAPVNSSEDLNTEAFTGVTLHLNPNASNASDSNDGGAARPLKTIQGACEKMIPVKAAGQPVRILLYPGTYRERLVEGGDDTVTETRPFWRIPENDTQLIFQAKEPGKTIISGSDVWTGWTDQGGGTWTKAWPYTWGSPRPNWSGPPISEYAGRRELVYVGGQRLAQVLSGTPLTTNTFVVDEAAKTITLKLAGGVNPNTTTTEVGVRSNLFYVWNRNNITLRGLVFQHSVNKFAEAAVAFQRGQGKRCSGIRVADTVIQENGQVGLENNCDTVRFVRNTINANGFAGITGQSFKGAWFEDNTTNSNGWRAWAGDYKGWATAGLKFFVVENVTIRRHTSKSNLATGLWIDYQAKNITVEDSLIANNFWDGLFLEASDGPFVAKNNLICNNGLSDVLFGSVRQVMFESNRVVSSATPKELPGQATALFFGETRRKDKDYLTGAPVEYPMRDITLKNNTIITTRTDRSLTGNYWYFVDPNSTPAQNAEVKADYEAFMQTLRAGGNTWYSPQARPFRLTSGVGFEEAFDFAGWKTLTKQDADSSFSPGDTSCPK
jgi:hypothetical protein